MSETVGSRKGLGMGRHAPLIGISILGMFLAILNQTVLNVVIPRLMTDFAVSANTAQWLLTGYMLVNGVLIPISAYMMETIGTRKLFIIAMSLFTIGSLLCGVAGSFSVMMMGRIVQAMGAGVIVPLVTNVVLFVFPPELRGRGMGILGVGMIFAPAVGPTLAGWVLEKYTWRLMFDGMMVMGLITVFLGILFMKDVAPKRKIPMDVLGVVLSIIGFGGILYGFSEAGPEGWSSMEVIVSLVVGGIGVFFFVIRQLSIEQPLLDFRVFKYDMFTLSTVINMIITMALYAGMFLLPIYLQTLRGFTPFESGLLLLPGALIAGLVTPISGILFDKIGPRPLAIVGLALTAATTFEFTQITLETSYSFIVMLYTVRSFAMSLLMMPIMTAGLNQLPATSNSHGNAMSNTMRQIAGSIGTALLTTVYTTNTSNHFATMTQGMNTYDTTFMQTFQGALQKFASFSGLPIDQAKEVFSSLFFGDVAKHAATMGINDAFYWATGFTLLGLLLSLFLRDVRKDKKKVSPEERKESTRNEEQEVAVS
ncbi:DHA2 family efflux MFS transporter permease subunit [Marininema halotolerans]|uniref:Drug resistance transporter, EmrB/QacA subfamily n=1 Tax=Marininema halotolerans TaxID=1155944 RepID=A0A1I6TIV6_9BACL|nr:DHA2 family efflux MFS transporter permease subunit [Marininema halotolerans]SFS89153.1 drug resistance transporter, EmrB/QacA subfamily [Marininema halotolerans]